MAGHSAVIAFFLLPVGLGLLWFPAGCRKKGHSPRVTINGRTWLVDLATTAEQRQRGLAGRTGLSEDVGMLFIFRRPKVLAFCMRGCHVPLDIAYIDSSRRVVKTYTMKVEPGRLGRRLYSSGAPAQYALEVSAGSLRAAGVKAGDLVSFCSDISEATKGRVDP